MLNFEQPPTTKEENKEAERTAFETREGEKFFAERLVNPEDPRVEKVQEILEKQFSKEEVDPIEAMKEAMTGKMETGEECAPYLVHVAENSKGEVQGLHTSAVVETVNSEGEESEKSALWLGCYAVTAPEARGKGVWSNLFKTSERAANEDAKRRGLEVKGFMAETHGGIEPILNKEGVKRAYIKTKEGYRELPYEQPPLDWNTKTGKPAEDAGSVPEHLMLKLSSGENKLSSKEFMEMVRGAYYYNNYREEEYFKSKKAYNAHTEFVEGIEQKLTDFIGRRKVQLLSAEERETMKNKGIKFIEHRKKEDRLEAGKAVRAEKREQRKEIEGALRRMGIQPGTKEEKEFIKAWAWFRSEVKKVESAKTPAAGMKIDNLFKEIGIEKPAESFEGFQKRLAEKLEDTRTSKGERLSGGDKLMMARSAYLKELGYSVEYKGLLLDKAEIRDENDKPLLNEKGKPVEFNSFYFSKTERMVNDFLKEKVKEKMGGKPAKDMTEDEKLASGYQKKIKEMENNRTNREEKISFLQKIKNFSKEKLSRLLGGSARLNIGEGLGIGLREGKKLAIEGGKDLAAIGLTPLAALEKVGRDFWTYGKLDIAEREVKSIKGEMSAMEKIKGTPLETSLGMPYEKYWDFLQTQNKEVEQEYGKALENVYTKGKMLKLIERLGGRLSKPIGRTVERIPPME